MVRFQFQVPRTRCTFPTAASPNSTSLTLLLGLGAFADASDITSEWLKELYQTVSDPKLSPDSNLTDSLCHNRSLIRKRICRPEGGTGKATERRWFEEGNDGGVEILVVTVY